MPPPRRSDIATVELIGGIEKRELVLADPDPDWPRIFQIHEYRIRTALGSTAVSVEHIGSTAVPGLAAKPIIDILVLVHDITAEEDYLPPLVNAGYVVRVREPGHRLVRTPSLDTHVHILQVGDPAAADYLLLRDHLRTDEADRLLYERVKRDLLARSWEDMNAYADAKTEVIAAIKQRAREGRLQ
ncbi:GrpB-like predicted nucleotidyltransferase (UPF0157 family) [Branchiibius hedensis]|uniref:GrpB domain, predicted nucleotidyltransferase, UPF0157 family n=1 Tax=Branchiibius hedensis TaxID=672460 RepID=A0A2Y8ZR42_9MICO|nr:GrpB family protein [Branchiibius hedensis]PWJ24993.1 GrpB-like predicted nucleotidyltransferase (UPF0157 family) [Branchiibius hedensis]SSA33808.1 GrpB domain, predicted nucleotidyltransferase, UPF0157 family [Branchiibius hedensis]